MIKLIGTEIFWVTIFLIPIIVMVMVFIGRAWSSLFPDNFKSNTYFYIAPAIGLGTLILFASIMGQIIPLGSLTAVVLLVILLLIAVVICRNHILEILRHSIIISVFGIICGVSLMVPLFNYGAINPHNDTFTYLAHSNWLQENAFSDHILQDDITPSNSQISTYQSNKFRMGSSFLLALFQSVFNFKWAYSVYPALTIVVTAFACLAIGFPIAQLVPHVNRKTLLLTLTLPALSLGGLAFSASFGFFPQLVALALGVALLLAVGFLLNWIITEKPTTVLIMKAALPCTILFSGLVFAYSELMLFMLLAIALSGLVLVVYSDSWKKIATFIAVFFGSSLLLLNVELVRIYSAIQTQLHSVVGGPVEWPLLGYITHAFGVHGGAWDMFQWTSPSELVLPSITLGLFIFSLLVVVLVASARSVKKHFVDGVFLPVIILIGIFIAGIIYFRFFVESPFSTGVGQSWSQFKLTEWMNPFLMVIILYSFVILQKQLGRKFIILIVTAFVVCLSFSVFVGMARIQPIVQYYGSQSESMDEFYIHFRKEVFSVCSQVDTPIYLNFFNDYVKFRQMAALYLNDREVFSDWSNDDYMKSLPADKRRQGLASGYCVVQSAVRDVKSVELEQSKIFGPFQIGIYQGNQSQVIDVIGAHGYESDVKDYWYWVEREAVFKIRLYSGGNASYNTRISFGYYIINSQDIVVSIVKNNGESFEFILEDTGTQITFFDRILDLHPADFSEIRIKNNGRAYRLGENDPRIASFRIINLTIEHLN